MDQRFSLELKSYLEIACEAAQKGGEILLKYWGRLQNIREKSSPGDLVTEADRESEEIIVGFLAKHCPFHQILSEESGFFSKRSNPYQWVIDPLDGTTNYTHQFPCVAVSIGLLMEGEPVLGVIFNPFHDELFAAARELGATLNDQKIHVSKVGTLSQSLLATGFAYDRQSNMDNNYREFCHLTHLSQGVRRLGAAALDLAYVACGRLDGYWERGLKEWDIAAGIVLVEEAGGLISDYAQEKVVLASGRILASNGLIHKALGSELLKARTEGF